MNRLMKRNKRQTQKKKKKNEKLCVEGKYKGEFRRKDIKEERGE
jgi:hypothetical protein